MFTIPLIILIFSIFGLVFKMSKGKIYKDILIYNSEDELYSNFSKLSKRLDIPKKSGKGIDVKPFEKTIKRAKNIINRKINKKNCIEEYEKTFANNYYLFESSLKNKNQMVTLPHIGDVPRIIIFSRAVISLSQGEVNRNRLAIALKGFLENTELSFLEIDNIKDALSFALLEKVNEIANVIISFRKLERISKSAFFIKSKFLDSNVFVYFLKKYNKSYYDKMEKYIDKYGRVERSQDVFYQIVENYNVILGNIVESLRTLGETIKNVEMLLPQYEILNNISSFQNATLELKNKILLRIVEMSDKKNILESEFSKSVIEKYGENACFYLLEKENIKIKAKNILKDTLYLIFSIFTLPYQIVINIVIFFKTILKLKSRAEK